MTTTRGQCRDTEDCTQFSVSSCIVSQGEASRKPTRLQCLGLVLRATLPRRTSEGGAACVRALLTSHAEIGSKASTPVPRPCGLWLRIIPATLMIVLGVRVVQAQCPGTNYALSFDGLDDVLDFGSGPGLPGASHTIECWVRAAVPGGTGVGRSHFDDTTNCLQGFFLFPGGYVVDRVGCNNSDVLSAPPVLGSWQHLAGTFDGVTMRLYVDGEQVASRTAVLSPGSRFTAGASWSFYFGEFRNFFRGDLDEVRVWSIARTEAQIRESMNVYLGGTETGLVGYWRFDEGSGQAANPTGAGTVGRFGASYLPDAQDPIWIVSTSPVSSVVVLEQPISNAHCPSAPVSFSVTAVGGGPFTYQWQWRPLGTTAWLNVVNGLNTDPNTGEPAFNGSGVTGVQLTMTNAVGNSAAVSGGRHEIHVVVSNSCGSVTSKTATWTICPADFDCDGFVTGDDFDAYVALFEAGVLAADFDQDGFVTGDDFDLYVVRFESGC